VIHRRGLQKWSGVAMRALGRAEGGETEEEARSGCGKARGSEVGRHKEDEADRVTHLQE
jgi:hypothetical protein